MSFSGAIASRPETSWRTAPERADKTTVGAGTGGRNRETALWIAFRVYVYWPTTRVHISPLHQDAEEVGPR